MIEVEGLTKYYGSVPALSGISFSVAEGEVAGFVGLNGAGKSTTMRILCGFMPSDGGRVKVGACEVTAGSIRARSLVGYLPEGVPLYPDMRVGEFLSYRAALKGLQGQRRREALDRVMTGCGIADVRRRIVGQLSKGYRQRVGVAEALLTDPPYLILDEPTVGLDPIQVRALRELLTQIGTERTIIFSTHILSEVEFVCDSVILIHRGRILARGTIDENTALGRNARGRAGARPRGEASEDFTLEDAFVALVTKADERSAA